MMHQSPNDGFEILARGSASPQQQVEYLQQVVKIKEKEISTLRLKIKTLELGKEQSELLADKRLTDFFKTVEYMENKKLLKVRKSWLGIFNRRKVE